MLNLVRESVKRENLPQPSRIPYEDITDKTEVDLTGHYRYHCFPSVQVGTATFGEAFGKKNQFARNYLKDGTDLYPRLFLL